MSRSSFLSLVALALAAPVLFHYGPSFLKKHENKVLDLGSSTAAASESVLGSPLESVKESVIEAAPAHRSTNKIEEKKTAKPAKMPTPSKSDTKKVKGAKGKQSAEGPSSLRHINALSGQPLPEAPTLKPAEQDSYSLHSKSSLAGAQERKFMGKDRNFSDPMKDRWVTDVSGANARVSFEKFRRSDNCQLAGTCERDPAPSDLNLAGVVVDSDQLRRPADKMIEGQLRRGHFINKTPAVYLK